MPGLWPPQPGDPRGDPNGGSVGPLGGQRPSGAGVPSFGRPRGLGAHPQHQPPPFSGQGGPSPHTAIGASPRAGTRPSGTHLSLQTPQPPRQPQMHNTNPHAHLPHAHHHTPPPGQSPPGGGGPGGGRHPQMGGHQGAPPLHPQQQQLPHGGAPGGPRGYPSSGGAVPRSGEDPEQRKRSTMEIALPTENHPALTNVIHYGIDSGLKSGSVRPMTFNGLLNRLVCCHLLGKWEPPEGLDRWAEVRASQQKAKPKQGRKRKRQEGGEGEGEGEEGEQPEPTPKRRGPSREQQEKLDACERQRLVLEEVGEGIEQRLQKLIPGEDHPLLTLHTWKKSALERKNGKIPNPASPGRHN